MASTNVSLEADRQYVQTLGTLAKIKRVSIGRLVREALDQKYGAELHRAREAERALSSFFVGESASEFTSELESMDNA